MKHTAAFLVLVATGCAGSELPDHERRALCSEMFETGENPYTFVRTESWRVGSLPFWTTPERIRASLGEPERAFQEVPWTNALRVLSYSDSGGPVTFGAFMDSVAYPKQFELNDSKLVTDRGTFEKGATLSDIRDAFPESYRCRDWPLGPSWSEGLYETEVFVEDTLRDARVALWFRDGGLVSVGVDAYGPEGEYRTAPR